MEEGCACALECSIKDKADCTFKERGATSSLPATPFWGSSLPATPSCGLLLLLLCTCVCMESTHCAKAEPESGSSGEKQTKQ